jgi:hypothetical protein
VLDRLVAVWNTRGPLGFLRFLASRAVGHRRDAIFAMEILPGQEALRWDGPGTLVCISRGNLDRELTPQLAAQLSRGEGAEYLAGLRHRDLMLAVVDGAGQILHHSFILFDTRTKVMLGEGADVPLFGHCVTRPEARGQRLYPRALQWGLAMLAQLGHRRAVINCDPDNRASIRGIEHAGFCRERDVSTWIIASCIGLQTGTDRNGRHIRRVYFG